MEIVKSDHTKNKGIYAKAVKAGVADIATAQEMVGFIDTMNGNFNGQFSRAFALAHSQVVDVEDPRAMFVVTKELTAGKNDEKYYFPSQIIMNARILEAPTSIKKLFPKREHYKDEKGKMRSRFVKSQRDFSNLVQYPEGCMSFPNRTAKLTGRYFRVKVRYQYPVTFFGLTILWRRTEWVEGLKAHIFQHELQHFDGRNMYYHEY
jgi:hypothetical protein